MDKKRTVILFGAGAVIPWGGPSTSELTELVTGKSSTYCCLDSEISVTAHIYKTLKQNKYTNEHINFETIINVIEELILHYAQFEPQDEIPSINSVFFQPKYFKEYSNFSIRNGGEKRHGYKLDIPLNKEYVYSLSAYNHETPEQLYFMNLLRDIIAGINSRVMKYAYHPTDKPENEIVNTNFQKWIKDLVEENNLIRMYTLNYDRIFKILTEKINIPIFEGFECGAELPYSNIDPDVRRIVEDQNSYTHYNLHGSSFWEVLAHDEDSQLFNPYITLSDGTILKSSVEDPSILQMDKGKNILLTNIITGYQKTQKSFVTPFRQMQAAFDKDCLIADEIWIVGYSLGDAHINTSIKTALKYNPKMKLILIDPAYDGVDNYNKKLVPKLIYIIPEIVNNERTDPI